MDANPLPMIADPPRAVPLLVRGRVLCGGFANQFGWLFLGFGLVFVWIFVGFGDVSSIFIFRGELDTAMGHVTHGEKTSFSEGGDENNDGTPIYAIHYTFTDEDDRTYDGVSYATGRELDAGANVTIEFPAGSPETSRIRGMRRAPFGALVLITWVFPLVGAIFVVAGLRKGVRGGYLLRNGRLAHGRLLDKKTTNTRINNRMVYKLTFAFEADDGVTYEAIARSHEPEKLEDEADELLLYDPLRPEKAVLLDNLPGQPRFDEFGQIRTGSVRAALRVLILPAVTIIGHGLYALLR
ncbi:MAG: DUF3592 domain-containing protein [Phycisphaerae bacterium]|jgi:hypothetical protein